MDGLVHNVVTVLLFLGIPVSALGLLALPWQARDRSLRLLVLTGGLIFAVTSLVFPVATTWGTFMHAAAPVSVLLVVSALGATDWALSALGARLGWTRPVAWLGALLAIGWSALFSIALLPSVTQASVATARTWTVLGTQLAAAGSPLDGTSPLISDHPIWAAEALRVDALALPNEPPSAVLDLARHFNARLLVIAGGDWGVWPAVLRNGDAASACFTELALPVPADPEDAAAVAGVRVWRIACP